VTPLELEKKIAKLERSLIQFDVLKWLYDNWIKRCNFMCKFLKIFPVMQFDMGLLIIIKLWNCVFLETTSAQGIAEVFVWVASFVTCQQVCCYWFSLGKTTWSVLRARRTEILKGRREKDGMWEQEIYN
jgi:hypothetical protein